MSCFLCGQFGKNNGQGMGYSTHDFELSKIFVAYENDKGSTFQATVGKSGVKCMIPEQEDKDVPCPKLNMIETWTPDNKKTTDLSVSIVYNTSRNETKLGENDCATTGSHMDVCNALSAKLGEGACRLVD